MKNSRGWIINAVLFAGVLGVCWAGIEIVLTRLDIPHFYKPHTNPVQFQMFRDSDGYVNEPSANIQFVYDGDPRSYFGPGNTVDHQTNLLGFRGKEFKLDKTPQVFRMAFLGDSFTFGEGVKFEDTYPEKAAALLTKEYAPRGLTFESYNFGVGGYNTAQELFLLDHIVWETQPDLIVLGFTLNDAEPKLFTYDPEKHLQRKRSREGLFNDFGSVQKPPQTFWFRSRLIQWIWKIFQQRELSAKTVHYYRELYRSGSPGWEDAQASLRRLFRTCENRKIHCIVVCFPLLYQLGSQYPFTDLHTQIRQAVLAEPNSFVHFIDLYDVLKGRRDKDLWVHPTDQHPNEIAHAIAAEAIAEEIEKIPGLISK